MKRNKAGTDRRTFLQQAALGSTALARSAKPQSLQTEIENSPASASARSASDIEYPRVFDGQHLAMLSFPLGGIGAGSIGLGGRGQWRDWEIFNRADKGNAPMYAFPSIWVQAGNEKPVTKVLEARILPPYEGQDGLGSRNVPGLERFDKAKFTGEFPLAGIEFSDHSVPVQISLEAFSPFIPHNADDSGLPVAILRYRVHNSTARSSSVSIAFSIDNPVAPPPGASHLSGRRDERENVYETSGNLHGIVMTNPALASDHPLKGSFAVCVLEPDSGKIGWTRGWELGRWWNSPMLFWDDFSADGELAELQMRNAVGAIYLKREVAAQGTADFTFLLAWHESVNFLGQVGVLYADASFAIAFRLSTPGRFAGSQPFGLASPFGARSNVPRQSASGASNRFRLE